MGNRRGRSSIKCTPGGTTFSFSAANNYFRERKCKNRVISYAFTVEINVLGQIIGYLNQENTVKFVNAGSLTTK